MNRIKENGTYYVALRIHEGYAFGNHIVKDMYCIMAQREDTLNWDFLEKSIGEREDAIKTALNIIGNTKVDLFDEGGYKIN